MAPSCLRLQRRRRRRRRCRRRCRRRRVEQQCEESARCEGRGCEKRGGSPSSASLPQLHLCHVHTRGPTGGGHGRGHGGGRARLVALHDGSLDGDRGLACEPSTRLHRPSPRREPLAIRPLWIARHTQGQPAVRARRLRALGRLRGRGAPPGDQLGAHLERAARHRHVPN